MVKTLIVGISGVSSSGKTTLARLLRDILPNSFILHQDDFYWPDSQIPVKDGIQDWDCLEAIDVSKLISCLEYIRLHGSPPSHLQSKEDQNSVGECGVNHDKVNAMRSTARQRFGTGSTRRVAFIDGFLLYSPELQKVQDLLDVKLFLRTDYETAKARREARTGYVTVEGFWEDPPGYVDKVVWPNYVKDHAFLFHNGDVQGPYDSHACSERSIQPLPESCQHDMNETLTWAFDRIMESLASS